jgi:hypothetical protein
MPRIRRGRPDTIQQSRTRGQITPVARHGEAIALRSMAIHGSAALMPISFGAAGALLGATGRFWTMAVLVGSGALFARNLESGHEQPISAA